MLGKLLGNFRSKLSILIIFGVLLISFWGIWNIFFQQDEWLGLGGAIYRKETFGTLGSIVQLFNFQNTSEAVRFLPVTYIANYLVYNSFMLDLPKYGILALVIIFACALTLNSVIYKLTNSYLLSTMTASLWVTNNLAYQAFSWIATMMPSLLGALFFLLGIYFLLLFNEKRKNYLFMLSIISIILSLFSKESGIFYLIPYTGLVWFFFKNEFKILRKIKLTIFLPIPILISLFIPRLISYFYNQNNFSPSINPASQIDIIYNFFLIPARSLFHILLSNTQIYEYVYLVNRVFFQTQIDGFVLDRLVGDAFSLMISFYLLLFILISLAFANKIHKKLILFSLFSFFAAFIPFIIFKNTAAILEPRFYILPAIFASFLIVVVIYSWTSKVKYFGSILTILVVIPILLFNIGGVKRMLAQDILVGSYRRGIIETVSEVKPKLGKDNYFYFFTGHTGFYEFQSGFGQALAVLLYDSGKIPKEVLIDRDFWDPSYEGIKQYNTGKYGYFMTYDKLVNAIKDNPDIGLDQVHAYYWDYQKHTVKNVSEDIRAKLIKDTLNEKIPQ